MKLSYGSSFLWIAFILLWTGNAVAQSSYDLRSPDGRIEIRIRTAQRVRYDVLFKGNVLLQDCALSLNVEHQVLGVAPKVIAAKERSYDQIETPVVRQKFAKIRDHYNELRLTKHRLTYWIFFASCADHRFFPRALYNLSINFTSPKLESAWRRSHYGLEASQNKVVTFISKSC